MEVIEYKKYMNENEAADAAKEIIDKIRGQQEREAASVARYIVNTIREQQGLSTLPPLYAYGSPQHGGLHTPTMQEIVARANQRDPTAPYFDPNSDHMRQINPLEPHWSGSEHPVYVNPLKPGLKISNLG